MVATRQVVALAALVLAFTSATADHPAAAKAGAGARGPAPPAEAAPAPEPARPEVSAFEAECAWTGKRVVNLLQRDDVETAREFDRFYGAFGCPQVHLTKAFGCVVASESDQEAIDRRVDRCWADPGSRLVADGGNGAAAGARTGAESPRPDAGPPARGDVAAAKGEPAKAETPKADPKADAARHPDSGKPEAQKPDGTKGDKPKPAEDKGTGKAPASTAPIPAPGPTGGSTPVGGDRN